MSGIKFSVEDFDRMLSRNKHIKVSAKSAGRAKKGALVPMSAQSAPVKVPFADSPHAKALAQLKKNPALRKGNQEHYEQVELFYWLETEYPDIYIRTHATPNSGKRGKLTAFKMQAEGQKKGVPDMALEVARGPYHGFRCELKTDIGKPSTEQNTQADRLRNDGFCVVFAYGLEAAKRAFLDYWHLTGNMELAYEYK
jgi:hypothetical protein